MGFTFDHQTLGQRVLFGTGAAVENAVAAVASLRARRVVLIADAFAMEISEAIAARTPVVARIHDIVQHVPVENARAAVTLATERQYADGRTAARRLTGQRRRVDLGLRVVVEDQTTTLSPRSTGGVRGGGGR